MVTQEHGQQQKNRITMNQNENRAVKFILDLQNLESQEGNENIEFPNNES